MTAEDVLRSCEEGKEGKEEEVWLVQLPPGIQASDLEGAKLAVKSDRLDAGKENVGALETERGKLNMAQESQKLVEGTFALIPDEKGSKYTTKKVSRRITLFHKEETSTPKQAKKRRRDSHSKKDKRKQEENE